MRIKANKDNFLDIVPDGTTILEPQDVFNEGIVGFEKEKNKLVYSCSKLLPALMEGWDLDETDAVEWIYYNTIRTGNYVENYPIILEDLCEDMCSEEDEEVG